MRIRSEKKTVVYILGLGHSGSTILEHLICQSSEAVGLGEVFKLTGCWAAESRLHTCTCGRKAASCELWGPLAPMGLETKEAWYKRLEGQLRLNFPSQNLWVDTSKSIREYKEWQRLGSRENSIELKIIYLVRDVRAWIWSDARVRARKNRRQRLTLTSMLFWYVQQLRFQRVLKFSGLTSHMVSYDALVGDSEKEMDKIFRFLKKPSPSNSSLTISDGIIHDVTGNRMKSNVTASTKIESDQKWRNDVQIRWWFSKLRPVKCLMKKIYKDAGFIKGLEDFK